jgi:hypothetical protein
MVFGLFVPRSRPPLSYPRDRAPQKPNPCKHSDLNPALLLYWRNDVMNPEKQLNTAHMKMLDSVFAQ